MATEQYHQELALHYVGGKKKVLFENGILMKKADFDHAGSLRETMKKLAHSPDRYDYRYAVSVGKLRKQRKRIKKPGAKEEVPRDPARVKMAFSAMAVICAMLVIGFGSAVMSAWHTVTFLRESKPLWTAVTISIMFILFSTTAFTAARHFFALGFPAVLFGFVFVAAGLCVLTYSAFSTFAVNYTQFTDASREKDGTQNAINRNRLLIELNRKGQEDIQHEIEILEADGEFWKLQSWRRYDAVQASVSEMRRRLRGLQEAESALVSETPEALVSTGVTRETVYSFISAVLGTGEEAVQFVIYVLPALLFDVLSPFAFSVVLFLADKRRQV